MESSRNEAVHIIRRLMGTDANEDDIRSELDEILESLQLAREEVRISEIFDGTNLKALTIGIGLVLFQQVCATNIFVRCLHSYGVCL
jgi:hypothetical protein